MKKKLLLLLLCSFLFLSFTSNKDITINGYIRMKGNDPFSYPVIIAENEKEYQIKSDSYREDIFVKLQGYEIEFTGHIETKKIADNLIYYFVIESYKVI